MSAADIGISVTVNGRSETYPADATVAEVVARVCRSPNGVAVAVGDSVVPRTAWDSWTLRNGDEVEILTAVQGG